MMKKILIPFYRYFRYLVFKVSKGKVVDSDRIKYYQNYHRKERCVIVGNGPSLKIEDLLRVEGEVVFGCNMIHRFSEGRGWHPTYYFCHDPKYVKFYSSELSRVKCRQRFIGVYWETVSYIKSGSFNKNNSIFYYLDKNPRSSSVGFSQSPEVLVRPGSTVSYSMLQFAIYMGFKEIYLIGFDHSFPVSCENGEVVLNNKAGHFKGYGEKNTNIVQKDIINVAFYQAKKFAEENEIKIYNATRGGDLEIFERVSFDDVFGTENG